MNKSIFAILITVFMLVGKAYSQKVLLPFGQFTQEPWVASHFYAPKGSDAPVDNWYATDFDDSGWAAIEGPISTKNGLSFFATSWESTNGTYWVRRHFSGEGVDNYSFVYLYIYHNDGCEIYLNGSQIYNSDKYFNTMVTVSLTEDMRSLINRGDNVLAMKVSDSRGGQAFLDLGLTATNELILANPDFDNNLDGWTRTGSGIQRGGQNYNSVARCLSNAPFDFHQTVTGNKGLYRLRVQAFEGVEDDYLDALYNKYLTDQSTFSYIYVGGNRHLVKNIYDEATSQNIYSSVGSGYYETPDFHFIPTAMNSVSLAYRDGLYENEMFAYIDATSFDVGIAKEQTTNASFWTVFDNFRLEYISEGTLETLVNSISSVAQKPMESGCRERLAHLSAELKAANGYEAKGRLLAAMSDDYVAALVSARQYALVSESIDTLQQHLATGSMMCPATITEVKDLITGTKTRLQSGTIPTSDVRDVVDLLNELNRRLSYTFVDVVVSEPGTLGDGVLKYVENFSDVQSIKISGTLNEADINNLQKRLIELREIDLTDLNMTVMPERLFYQRSKIEIVRFPTRLTAIGQRAFSDCDNLRQVLLPEGLTTLGEYAFYSCDNNKYVRLPSSLKAVSENAFYANVRLKQIDFAEGLSLISYGAFYRCTALRSLHFPSTLRYIASDAFMECRWLSDLSLNEGLYQIADNAFKNCDALTEVTLPSSLVLANESPFDHCDNLKKVTCLSIEPPYMTDQIPYGLSMEGRELYVPAIAINAYKQSIGWDKFQTIQPHDILPQHINVIGDVRLSLPDDLPADYKPTMDIIHDRMWSYNEYQYGHLTVTGESLLSLSHFSMVWDPNIAYETGNNYSYTTLINNSQIRSDSIAVTVFLRNNRWNFVSFPFDVKVAEITPTESGTTSWTIRRYDGQRRANGESGSTWVKLGANDIMEAGKGYILQANRYDGNSQYYSGLNFKALNNGNKNNIFLAADANVPLKEYNGEFAHNRSWNLVGNPYPCYYDTRFLAYSSPITVWNVDRETYNAYSPLDDTYVLCPGESFFVQCPKGVEGIGFDKSGRQASSKVRDSEASRATTMAGSQRTIVNLLIGTAPGAVTDRTRVVLNDAASIQYEMDKDASKFISAETSVPQIYTVSDGVDYAINERPVADGIARLAFRAATDGRYAIALASDIEGYRLTLEDTYTGHTALLTEATPYTFDAKAGTDRSRFILHFTGETVHISERTAVLPSSLPIYTTSGVRVAFPSRKGLYIQGGKKVIINK